MRGFFVSVFAVCALLVPVVGAAQVMYRPPEPPVITAATAQWQIAGGPLFHGGNFYYPAGPSIFFDGNVMVRTGVYEGVPVYADTTLEPWSIVYVPVGGNVMRPYERLRAGDLAGTTGSRTPSFPVQGPNDPAVLIRNPGDLGIGAPEPTPRVVRFETTNRTPVNAAATAPGQVTVETIPRPTGNEGVWINYEGARWYHSGKPARYTAERFVPFGSYRGFPVFKELNGSPNVVYVTNVPDGPLVPYAKR
jgi:hypothetical protein